MKGIRTLAGMSQAEFARAFYIDPRATPEWEQGRHEPDATKRAYVEVIVKNREAEVAALTSSTDRGERRPVAESHAVGIVAFGSE